MREVQYTETTTCQPPPESNQEPAAHEHCHVPQNCNTHENWLTDQHRNQRHRHVDSPSSEGLLQCSWVAGSGFDSGGGWQVVASVYWTSPLLNIYTVSHSVNYYYYYSKKNTYATTHTQPQILTTTHSAPRNTQTVRLAWLTDSRRTPDTGMNDLPSSQQPPTSHDTPARDTGVSTLSCLVSRAWADQRHLCSVIY